MARNKVTVQSLLENSNPYKARLRICLTEITFFMLGKLDTPVLADKDQTLTRKNRRRKIITQ
jgi:hypothetical protein